MDRKSKYQTLAIVDLETTGLIYDDPKITELALIAVNITTLEEMTNEEELPRILNKFVKFFNPMKELRGEVVELTGLNNSMLEVYPPFNRQTVMAIEAFLNNFLKPICFVAHNGNLFDFPILFKEIQSALSTSSYTLNTDQTCVDDIKSDISTEASHLSIEDSSVQTSLFSIDCADSLVFFREMYRLLNDKDLLQSSEEKLPVETVPSPLPTTTTSHLGYVEIPIKYVPSMDPARQQLSMKLIKIYEREFSAKSSILRSHHAEDDCLMLLAILKRYLPDWLEWIDVHTRQLNDFHSYPLTTTRKKSPPKPVINRKPPLRF